MAIPKINPGMNPFQMAGSQASKGPSALPQLGGAQKLQAPQFAGLQKLQPSVDTQMAGKSNLTNPSMAGGGSMPGFGGQLNQVAQRLDLMG